jgi:hypothetical protein
MFDPATDDDRAILQAALDGIGAIVMGRKNEGDRGWGDAGPARSSAALLPPRTLLVEEMRVRVRRSAMTLASVTNGRESSPGRGACRSS